MLESKACQIDPIASAWHDGTSKSSHVERPIAKLTKRVSGFDSSLEVPGAYRASLVEPRHPSGHIRRGKQANQSFA